ncbi:thermonuclease family protein [Halodesulfovibrio aestuarii]|uniref:thermonuclease family protein n=1 Tax=Halodesulfovibrio aestuarii TaxID=126333 RepID=UPI003D34C8C8
MVKKRIFFLGILCFLYATALSAFADTTHVVTAIVDGDTLILENGKKVRIAFVDTPELGDKKRKQQYFSSIAKKFIGNKVLGREVSLQKIVANDRYKRLVAIVRLRNGCDLGALLVQNGMAFVYPHGMKQSSYITELEKLQKKAMDARVGMWDKIIPHFKNTGSVIGNRRSRRFFALDCKFSKEIANKNKVPFISAVDAFYNGYAPARICKLWPNDTEILEQ